MSTSDTSNPSLNDIEKSSCPPTESEPPSHSLANRPKPIVWFCICSALFVGAFLYGLDTTISAAVQAPIYEEFHNIEKLPWVGTGFPMGSVAVILLVGTLFAKFNVKPLILGFFTLFEVGSALCGAAPNTNVLIVGRVIAGMGGCGMYVGVLNFYSFFTTLKERPMYNALCGISWGVGAIIGPVVGGALSVNHHATWRWAFYINLPLAAVLGPILLWLFPSHSPQPGLSVRHKLAQIDWVGAVLNAGSFVLLVVALTFSGSTWAWESAGTIVTWVLFGVVAASYMIQQTFSIFTTPKQRIFPLQFLRSRTMVLLYLATAAASTGMYICLYYIPLFFQFTRGDSALKAAIRLLPLIIPEIIAMMMSGALMPVVKRYAPWYLPAGVMLLVASCLLYQITPTTHTLIIYGMEVLTGFGAGLSYQIAYSVVAAKLSESETSVGIGFINVAQIGSVAVALSIAGCIFQNVGFSNLKNFLSGFNIPEDVLRGALAGAKSTLAGATDPRIPELVTEAVVKTIRTEFAIQISAGALMIVTSLLMKWEKITLKHAAGD